MPSNDLEKAIIESMDSAVESSKIALTGNFILNLALSFSLN